MMYRTRFNHQTLNTANGGRHGVDRRAQVPPLGRVPLYHIRPLYPVRFGAAADVGKRSELLPAARRGYGQRQSSNWGQYRFTGFARRDLTFNQMVAVGADAIYEDECFIWISSSTAAIRRSDGDNGSTALLFQFTFKTMASSVTGRSDDGGVLQCSMTAAFACGDWRHLQPRGWRCWFVSRRFPPRSMPRRQSRYRSPDTTRIVAVVNGDVISNVDVNNRTRLFALSTGLPMSPDVLDRLKPQITAPAHRRAAAHAGGAAAQDRRARQEHRGGDPRDRAAQRHGRRAALPPEACIRWRQPAHADRPDPHPARLDPGAAPAVGRQVAGDRCRGGRAAAAARSARRQAGISASARFSFRSRTRPARPTPSVSPRR